jgi:TolB-like protein/Tfp pilus assembly protein PilF
LIDIVGYSNLLINEQREQLRALNEIVRNAAQFRGSDARGMLVRIPTGDGVALIFRDSLEAPLRCALEISAAVKIYPEIRLPMGIHSGPVSDVTDVNERANIAGAGIDLAQRVMDCGDAGHILLSKRVADDLAPYPRWNPYLHDLGECEVKHGRRIFLVNFYTAELGNPQSPEKLKKPQAQEAATEAPNRLSRVVRSRTMIVGAAFVAPAAAIAFLYFSLRSSRPSTEVEKSVAVLPFENLSEDKGNAYFAEGIQEEILMRLAKIGDLSEIARRLGVANILEGSVQKAGDRVGVNVELINAGTEAHLWAETCDRSSTDIFALESEIASMVADTLRAKLTGSERSALAKRPTTNPEACELYLKGRLFWNKRTAGDFKTAIAYFQQAIDKTPDFALAYAGLADAYIWLPVYGAIAPRDAFPQAKAAAEKALELDTTLAEAHASLAMVLLASDFDYNRALAEFKRAIELNPNYATAHQWLGVQLYSALGQFDESIMEARRALELDPLSLIINAELGWAYLYPRRFDEAIDQLRKTLELDRNFHVAHWDLGEALEFKGLTDAAILEYEIARQLDENPHLLGRLGHAYAAQGRRDDALKLLAQLNDEAARRYVPAYSVAIVHLGLGNKQEAIRWLEKGFNDRDGIIGIIKIDPTLDSLHGDPSFEALVQKILAAK